MTKYRAAVRAYNKGDYTTALRLMRPLADQAKAQFYLGLMVSQGGAHKRAHKLWERRAMTMSSRRTGRFARGLRLTGEFFALAGGIAAIAISVAVLAALMSGP